MLGSDPCVRALLDPLAEVDKDREGFGTSGGADPVFVALTSRATEIGRAIQVIAEQRRDTLRAVAGRLAAPSAKQAVALRAAVDTSGWSAERDSAQASLAAADSELVQARNRVSEY